MSAAFGWRSAWDEYPEDEEYRGGMKYYDIPSEKHSSTRIYVGDQFWMPDERYLITVDKVMTQIYRGVVGHEGDEGNDCVFYTPDWQPPRHPHSPKHYEDDIYWMSVDEFAKKLDSDELIAHKNNGPPRLPP